MTTEKTIEWTQRDIQCAEAVLANSTGDGFSLPMLTDEEIVALDGLERSQAVALPWLDLHTEQRELACNVALRSLLSKGLAFPLIGEGDTAPSGLGAVDEITGILTLRRLGERVVTAELTKYGDRAWLYGYVHADQVLEEVVDSAGSHTFTVVSRLDFPDRLMTLANAAGVDSVDGDPVSFTAERFAQVAEATLKDTRGVTTISAISLDPDTFRHYTIYTQGDQLHGMTASEDNGMAMLNLATISRVTGVEAIREVVEAGL